MPCRNPLLIQETLVSADCFLKFNNGNYLWRFIAENVIISPYLILERNVMFGILNNYNVPKDPARMNEIVLAYLGDCVYELYVRNLSVQTGEPKVYVLNKMSSARSKASYQAAAIKKIEPELDDIEAGIVRRAKNKKITSKPKNATPMDYKAATSFEALVGYLYLTNQHERMESIIAMALDEFEKDSQKEENPGGSEGV